MSAHPAALSAIIPAGATGSGHEYAGKGASAIVSITTVIVLLPGRVRDGEEQTGSASKTALVSRRGCRPARRKPILRLPVDRTGRPAVAGLQDQRPAAHCPPSCRTPHRRRASRRSWPAGTGRRQPTPFGTQRTQRTQQELSQNEADLAGSGAGVFLNRATCRCARRHGGLRWRHRRCSGGPSGPSTSPGGPVSVPR